MMLIGTVRGFFASVALSALGAPIAAASAQSAANLSGMWGDPPLATLTLEDVDVLLCQVGCTDVGIARLNALLEDPANDSKSFGQLRSDARAYEEEHYYRPRLTAAALARYPLDPADDPTFLLCEPLGAARQFTTRHQLEIKEYPDRVEFHYAEWDARRVVWLDGRQVPVGQPSSKLGFSVGHYEGDALVVETTNIAADRARWDALHSDQLRIVERFRRSQSGERLELAATHEDPWSLKEPITVKRIWTSAPDDTIAPYEDCRPVASALGEKRLP